MRLVPSPEAGTVAGAVDDSGPKPVNARAETVAQSVMFGDNKTVVDSAAMPNARLHKRHTMLSFHRVRQTIASNILSFFHIPGELNCADILSKHWGHSQVWDYILRPLLYWVGRTTALDEPNDLVTTEEET